MKKKSKLGYMNWILALFITGFLSSTSQLIANRIAEFNISIESLFIAAMIITVVYRIGLNSLFLLFTSKRYMHEKLYIALCMCHAIIGPIVDCSDTNAAILQYNASTYRNIDLSTFPMLIIEVAFSCLVLYLFWRRRRNETIAAEEQNAASDTKAYWD